VKLLMVEVPDTCPSNVESIRSDGSLFKATAYLLPSAEALGRAAREADGVASRNADILRSGRDKHVGNAILAEIRKP